MADDTSKTYLITKKGWLGQTALSTRTGYNVWTTVKILLHTLIINRQSRILHLGIYLKAVVWQLQVRKC